MALPAIFGTIVRGAGAVLSRRLPAALGGGTVGGAARDILIGAGLGGIVLDDGPMTPPPGTVMGPMTREESERVARGNTVPMSFPTIGGLGFPGAGPGGMTRRTPAGPVLEPQVMPQVSAQFSGGAMSMAFRPTVSGFRARSIVAGQHPSSGDIVYWRYVGRAKTFEGDRRVVRSIKKEARRLKAVTGGR